MPPSALERILDEASRLTPEERRALVDALMGGNLPLNQPRYSSYGKYAGMLTPVDEFLRMKHEETNREDRGIGR